MSNLRQRLAELERRGRGYDFAIVEQRDCESAEELEERIAAAQAKVGPGGDVFIIRDLERET